MTAFKKKLEAALDSAAGRLSALVPSKAGAAEAGRAEDRVILASVEAAEARATAIKTLLAKAIARLEGGQGFAEKDLDALRGAISREVAQATCNGRNWLRPGEAKVTLGPSALGGVGRNLEPVDLDCGIDGLALPEPSMHKSDAASLKALATVLHRAKSRAESAAQSFQSNGRFLRARLASSGGEGANKLSEGNPRGSGAAPVEAENPWVENAKTIGIALLIALFIRAFLFQPFNIPSGSMMSTLLIGDYLFVSKYSYGFSRHSFPFSFPPFEGRVMGREPTPGDVIVFKNARDNNKDYIKRLVGMPGDEIQMIKGVLHINQLPVQRRLVGEFEGWRCDRATLPLVRIFEETLPNGATYKTLDAYESAPGDNTAAFTVPEGEYFLMGDNRDCSTDSRFSFVGTVEHDKLIGKAEMLFFSADGAKGQIWQLWRWPIAIRWGRIFQGIQ